MTDFANSVVLITGAAGGFGREMVRQFLVAGSRLILHDLYPELLQTARNDYADGSERVLASIAADLSHPAGCQILFDEVRKSGLEPDILINNAGIGVGGRHDLVPRDRWEQVMQVNLLSPMRICELFMPQMIERQSGHIVNISSIAGWVGSKRLSAYSAAKFGLRGFGESLARDVEEHGIIVSTVYPWFSRTAILDSEQFGPEEKTEVPDDLVTDPADVVARMLQGIAKNKQHIFPDKMAARVQFAKRHFPRLFNRMMRRMEQKVLEENQKQQKEAS